MNQYMQLKNMLEELGINVIERNEDTHGLLIITPHKDDYPETSKDDFNKNEKIIGYSGFECVFEFDESGKFINVGVWE